MYAADAYGSKYTILKSVKETIIVEGKDDKSAVLRAVDANIICTSGFGLNETIISDIRCAYEKTGIIIFTDPDHAGRSIREKLTALFPEAKHAYLTKSQSLKKGDVGIENAGPYDIIKALAAAEATGTDASSDITMADLNALGLAGDGDSAEKREKAGTALGIGYGNAKAFLKRLRFMGITKKTLEKALRE